MPVAETTMVATTNQTDLATRIERAMADAAAECAALGITDPALLRARILDARNAAIAAG